MAGAEPRLDLGTKARVLDCVDAEARLAIPTPPIRTRHLLREIGIETAHESFPGKRKDDQYTKKEGDTETQTTRQIRDRGPS